MNPSIAERISACVEAAGLVGVRFVLPVMVLGGLLWLAHRAYIRRRLRAARRRGARLGQAIEAERRDAERPQWALTPHGRYHVVIHPECIAARRDGRPTCRPCYRVLVHTYYPLTVPDGWEAKYR